MINYLGLTLIFGEKCTQNSSVVCEFVLHFQEFTVVVSMLEFPPHNCYLVVDGVCFACSDFDLGELVLVLYCLLSFFSDTNSSLFVDIL